MKFKNANSLFRSTDVTHVNRSENDDFNYIIKNKQVVFTNKVCENLTLKEYVCSVNNPITKVPLSHPSILTFCLLQSLKYR